jgi:hypothetical protein
MGDEDDFGSDDEGEDFDAHNEDDDTVPCPYCRRLIHDEAEQCPYCEAYISEEDQPFQPRPWWFVIGFLLCLLILLMWILAV